MQVQKVDLLLKESLIFTIGLKLLFQLRVGLSPLYAHKKNHNFSDTLCDKCDVCKSTENLEHFSLNCIRFTEARRTLLNSVLTLNVNFNQLNPQNKIQLLLYGDTSFSDVSNKLLLISTLKLLRDCERFPITSTWPKIGPNLLGPPSLPVPFVFCVGSRDR